MVSVYIKKISELSPEEENKIISSLSESARARLEKKTNDSLRRASLCALSLLGDKERAALDYSSSGRPRFSGLQKDISISHCDSYAAVALSDAWREWVGIDIEDLARESSASARFLTENECRAFEAGTSFVEIWTKKEALFKFLKSDTAPFIHLDSTRPDLCGAKLQAHRLDSVVLSVCTAPNTEIKIIEK